MIDAFHLLFDPAHLAIAVSLLFAALSLAAVLMLYVRRRLDERKAPHEAAFDLDLSRQLMATLGSAGRGRAMTLPERVDPDDLERVFSRLVQLVRGEDRERLLAIADALHIPESALAALQSRSAARRIDALRILERFPSDRVVSAIHERMIADPDAEARAEAAATLSRIGQPPSPAEVIDALDLRARVPNLLHAAIFRAGAPLHAREIASLVRSTPSGLLQSMLIEALGWSEDFAILPDLAEFASATTAETRIASLKAARHLGHPGVRDWAIPLLLDPDDNVRVQATRTCGQLGLTDAIPILAKLVENSSWWVRTRAAEALAILRPDQPAPFAVTGLRK